MRLAATIVLTGALVCGAVGGSLPAQAEPASSLERAGAAPPPPDESQVQALVGPLPQPASCADAVRSLEEFSLRAADFTAAYRRWASRRWKSICAAAGVTCEPPVRLYIADWPVLALREPLPSAFPHRPDGAKAPRAVSDLVMANLDILEGPWMDLVARAAAARQARRILERECTADSIRSLGWWDAVREALASPLVAGQHGVWGLAKSSVRAIEVGQVRELAAHQPRATSAAAAVLRALPRRSGHPR